MLNPLLSGNGALRRVGTEASPEERNDEGEPRGEQQRSAEEVTMKVASQLEQMASHLWPPKVA